MPKGKMSVRKKQIRLWVDPELFLKLERMRVSEEEIDLDMRGFVLKIIEEKYANSGLK